MNREWQEKLQEAMRELYDRALAEPIPDRFITTLDHLNERDRRK